MLGGARTVRPLSFKASDGGESPRQVLACLEWLILANPPFLREVPWPLGVLREAGD